LKLTCDETLSNFAFKFNLRRYSEGHLPGMTQGEHGFRGRLGNLLVRRPAPFHWLKNGLTRCVQVHWKEFFIKVFAAANVGSRAERAQQNVHVYMVGCRARDKTKPNHSA
jgi:hypothetical protein